MQSQNQQILRYMKSRPIDPLTAFNAFRCLRLAARIAELKEQGYKIVTEMKEQNGKRFASYRLAK